jgi:hypothetical protein
LGLSSFDNTTIGATSGTYHIISPGASTVLGFSSSNGYIGYTAGTGISFAGGQISATGTGNITGTLTATYMPVASGASTLANSLATDNGTTFTYTGSGGIVTTGTTPGLVEFTTGSGTVASLPTNSMGFVGPLSGGTPYLIQFPNTAVAGFLEFPAPASEYGVNVTQPTFVHVSHTIGASGEWGFYTAPAVIAQAVALNNGHFTNLSVTNLNGGSCATAPTFQVFDTASHTGVSQIGSTTQQAFGTSSNVGETLAITAGDTYGVYISNTGSCTAPSFSVVATVEEP